MGRGEKVTQEVSSAMPTAVSVWSTQNVADYIGIQANTVNEWLKRGLLPRPAKVLRRRRWNGHLIQKWIPQEWLHLSAIQIRYRLEATLAEKAVLQKKRKKTRTYLQRIVLEFEKKMNQFYLKMDQLEQQINDMKGGL
jgi:predicted DNA-binding transcriptional regulator AlpA